MKRQLPVLTSFVVLSLSTTKGWSAGLQKGSSKGDWIGDTWDTDWFAKNGTGKPPQSIPSHSIFINAPFGFCCILVATRSHLMDMDFVVSNSVEFWVVHLLRRSAGKGRP